MPPELRVCDQYKAWMQVSKTEVLTFLDFEFSLLYLFNFDRESLSSPSVPLSQRTGISTKRFDLLRKLLVSFLEFLQECLKLLDPLCLGRVQYGTFLIRCL
jgi:hypothetical protein